jgi:hypothetical protein
MSVYRRAPSAAFERLRSPWRRGVRAFAVLALAAIVAGCWTPPPAPLAGRDPSDPSARTRPVGYRSTIAPYSKQRPVDPAPWRQQNEQVAPRPKQ